MEVNLRKILSFVGHYDYLISHMLFDSSLKSRETVSDYIFLGTKNSDLVNDFITRKSEAATEFGRFAILYDEEFLDKRSIDDTRNEIIKKYGSIMDQFQMTIGEYDHIYMSFDEWNSFGIFLQTCQNLPPVTVFIKHENQLTADIYHFLEMPGKFHFAHLQRENRVLNAEAPYITDIVVLRDGFVTGEHFGKTMRGFQTCKVIQEMDVTLYKGLCNFFQFNPRLYCKEKNILIVGDSYWFENANSKTDEYMEIYQILLNHLELSGMNVIFKVHPRYHLGQRERDLLKCKRIFGMVPIELLCREESMSISQIYSIGNGIPEGVVNRAEHVEIFCNDIMFWYRYMMRLDYLIKTATKNGVQKLSLRNCNPSMENAYRQLYGNNFSVELLFEEQQAEDENTWIVYKDVDSGLFHEEILPLVRQNKRIFILNPEFHYELVVEQEREFVLEQMVSIGFRKYAFEGREFFDAYEYMIWGFCQDPVWRQKLERDVYSDIFLNSGYRVRTNSFGKRKGLIVTNIHPAISKEYIQKKVESSPVIIYGGGSLAYEFIKKYEKILSVRYIMVDSLRGLDSRLKKRFRIVLFQDADIRSQDYVVICKSFIHNIDIIPKYALARDEMLRRRYPVCEKFVYYRLYDAIVQKKPIMLFCGYCELGGIKQILDLTSAKEDYGMLFYHIGRETMKTAPGYDDFVATVKLCDILVHAPLLVTRDVLDADVISLVSEKTQMIFIPQISFRGYAPYKSAKFTKRNYILRLFDIVRYPFLYQFDTVNTMLLNGASDEEVLIELHRDDLFSEEEVKQNLNQALRILEIMDAKADIPIFDFVRDNYQKELMFKDCIHANDVVFFEYARRLSDYLGKEYQNEINHVEKKCKEKGAYFQVASEEPILPCVAKTLGLEFATKDRLYMEKVTEERIRMRTLDDWIKDYCAYFRAVLVVKRTLNRNYHTQKVTIFRNEENIYQMDED